jgi:hypothetical protein
MYFITFGVSCNGTLVISHSEPTESVQQRDVKLEFDWQNAEILKYRVKGCWIYSLRCTSLKRENKAFRTSKALSSVPMNVTQRDT